jgi:hypothetical protein
MSISSDAKAFLISLDIKPRYINKGGVRCLSMMSVDSPLYVAQKILNELLEQKTASVELFKAFLHFKFEGFGLDSTIFWPDIPWED